MISLHFSHKGWIEHISPMELIVVNNDFQLEAIKTTNVRNVSVYINNEPLLLDNRTQKGQTGKSLKIRSLALVSNDKNKEIYYRIYTSFGFSDFCKDGTYVGISDDQDKIIGFQYFVINKKENPEPYIKKLNLGISNYLNIGNANTHHRINYQINVLNDREDYDEYINIIERVISNPDIKYISFDIFDTLLERPVIKPTDIFSIVDSICKKNGLINNFTKNRSIEAACRKFLNREPSLDDIYDYMNVELGLDNNILEKVKAIELDCEFKLLKRRSLVSRIYNYAVKHNKKIICVSDMYLSSEFLISILNKEGYNYIEKVFVSNEFNATKRSGSLFGKVLDDLNILPESLIHIGDNLVSDYKIPVNLGICSFCIPSSYELFRKANPSIFENGVSDDPMARIAVGYFINEYSKRNTSSTTLVDDLDEFIMLGIALPIVMLTLQICFNSEIQNKYKQILFASRDGYLIKRVYDIFKERFNYLLDSKYVYTGRKSYFSAKYETFELFCASLSNDITPRIFIRKFVYDEQILKKLNVSEINLDSVGDMPIFLNKNQELLSKYYENHRNEAKKYYASITSNSDREIIFDIGYNGSISSISYYINKIIDKIYFRQSPKNIEIDNLLKSKTFCLLKHGIPFSLLPFEEFLAPLEGSTIGYTNSEPILEKEEYSDRMVKVYSRISYIVCDVTRKLIDHFDYYSKELMIDDSYVLFRFYHSVIINRTDSRNFFTGCIMKDTFWRATDTSLLSKMFSQSRQKLRSVFDLTTVKNSCYFNYNYDRSFYDLLIQKKIAIYLDVEDISKIPYILTNIPVYDFDIYVCAPHNLHGVISNLFASCKKFLLFDKLEGKESLFSWVCNSVHLDTYDSVLVLTTAKDTNYYPLSEFLNNLNHVFSVYSVMQVLFMINDLNLTMLSLPFTRLFEHEFSDNYKLYSDKLTISLVASYFSWCKKMLGSETCLDDYPIELNEYSKLFNESFWYCPRKIPKELRLVPEFENCDLFTNQRLSVLIPVLLNRVNDLSFKYFSD